MKKLPNSLPILIVTSLLTISQCLKTYTTVFRTDQFVTSGSNTLPRSFQSTPMYPLGDLTAGMTLKFVFDVPDVANKPIGGINMRLHYGQTDHNRLPVGTFSNSLCLADPAYTPFHCEFTYLVQQTDYHALQLIDSIISVSQRFVQHFTLQVTYYNASLPLSVGSNNGQILLNMVDIHRSRLYKVVYLNVASDYKVTLSPVISTDTNKAARLFPITKISTNSWPYTRTNQLTGASRTFDNLKQIVTYDTSLQVNSPLQPGYYLFEVQFDPSVHPVNPVIVTWQSDTYACPFRPSFNDFYDTFQPCSHEQSPQTTWPCSDYNPDTRICSGCVDGFTLSDNKCITGISCPPRQYFRFGVCYNVSVLCGDYNFYGGACLNCSDPVNYELQSGVCVLRTVTCGDRQYKSGSICYNVNEECQEFDPNTGHCTSCKKQNYEVKPDGSCQEKFCLLGQYLDDLECKNIPFLCIDFNFTLKKCLKCSDGYFVNSSDLCQRNPCPDRQYPSPYGGFCIAVSPLCGEYDPVSGLCLTCNQNGYVPRNGVCLQVKSPLAGCRAMQELGFGQCPEALENCLNYDLQTLSCIDCEDGFYKNYQHRCVPEPLCGQGHIPVNGNCVLKPPNCKEVNKRLGFCSQCDDGFSLANGLCYQQNICPPGSFRDDWGNCWAGKPNCRLHNPTNGDCIVCQEAGTYPTHGYCCSMGQVYYNGQCLPLQQVYSASQILTGSACVVRHPRLGHCLRCVQGWIPNVLMPQQCVLKQ